MTTLEKLNGIFCVVFDDAEIVVGAETTANDIDGWDSLSHVNLVVAVENGFGIKFNRKEVITFKNVGDMLSCIEKKLAEKA